MRRKGHKGAQKRTRTTKEGDKEMKTPITQSEINAFKEAVSSIRNAIAKDGGRYVPSAQHTDALKALFSDTYGSIGEREYGRFANYLMQVDMYNLGAFHSVIAEESHLEAIEKALAWVEAVNTKAST